MKWLLCIICKQIFEKVLANDTGKLFILAIQKVDIPSKSDSLV